MIPIIHAELLRLVSRRFFRLLGVLLVVGVVGVALITFFTSSSDPNAGLGRAQAEVAQCHTMEQRAQADHPEATFDCPTVKDLSAAFDKRFHYTKSMPNAERGIAIAGLTLGLIAAASFVGAEWGTGTMTTTLTWEPRRGRLLAAKAIVCIGVVAAAVVVLLAFTTIVFLPVGHLRGTVEGIPWWTLSGIWARATVFSTFGCALAIAFTMFFRNTAGAIGTGVAYGAIVDPLLSAWHNGALRAWFLQYNIARVIGFEVPVQHPGDPFASSSQILSPGRSLIVFAIYVAVLLGLAYAVFSRRDVT